MNEAFTRHKERLRFFAACMRFFFLLFVAALLWKAPLIAATASAPDITVAAYYYPCEHPDPRWDKAKYPGFTEWDLIRKAKPRFPGHKQPKVPLWGYTDESDPKVMAQKIDAAANYGVNVFIFDWYYYNDGPYLQARTGPWLLPGHEQPPHQVRPYVGQP